MLIKSEYYYPEIRLKRKKEYRAKGRTQPQYKRNQLKGKKSKPIIKQEHHKIISKK